jgi:hypothetical protein
MRKLLNKLLKVSFLTAIIYILVLFAAGILNISNWIPNTKSTLGGYGQMLLRMREVKEIKEVDILFLGSSHIYRGFDPRIFKSYGISTFNLGSSSQTPLNSYYLLKDQLPKIKVKFIVFDLYWGVLQSNGVESSIDIVSNTELSSNLVEMSFLTKDLGTYKIALLSSITRLYKPLSESQQIDFRTDNYIHGGFTESTKSKNSLTKEQLNNIESYTIDLNESQIEYVKKIKSLTNEHNVKIIFVITPVTKEYFSKAKNYNEYKSQLYDIIGKNNLLFDYNEKNDLTLNSSTDFYDINHLTQDGVEKFNRSFIADLKAHKIL